MIAVLSSILSVNFLTQLFKKAVAKYGNTWVHVMVLGFSFLVTIVWAIAQHFVGLQAFFETAIGLFTASITAYHVIFKEIGKAIPGVSESDLSS